MTREHHTEFFGNHAKVLKSRELPNGTFAVAIEMGDKYVVLSLMTIARCEVYTPFGTDMLGPDPIVKMQTVSTQSRVIKREDFNELTFHEKMQPDQIEQVRRITNG